MGDCGFVGSFYFFKCGNEFVLVGWNGNVQFVENCFVGLDLVGGVYVDWCGDLFVVVFGECLQGFWNYVVLVF